MNIKYAIVKNEMPASSAEAKYLGIAVPNGVRNRSQMTALALKNEHFTEATFGQVIDAAVVEIRELCAAGRDVDWGPCKFLAKMHGSLPCEDSAFADGTASLTVDADATNATRAVLETLVPVKMTAAALADAIKVSNVMDVATELFGTVVGTTQFVILGNGITLDGEGEYAKALDKKTGEVKGTATVVSVSKGQRAYCKFDPQLAGGDYTLEVATKGLIGEATPRVFRKPVTAVYVAPSLPTISKVHQNDQYEDNVVSVWPTAPIVITGDKLALAEGDTVQLKWKDRQAAEKSGALIVSASTDAQITCTLGEANCAAITADGVALDEEMEVVATIGDHTTTCTVKRGSE